MTEHVMLKVPKKDLFNQYKKEGVKYVHVQRNDDKFQGSVVEIPIDSLPMTLKVHPTWVVVEKISGNERRFDVPVENAPKQDKLICPICGFEAKNKTSLKSHKTRKHG